MKYNTDNPLGDYFDELLAPAANQPADWDTLLSEAVAPHKQLTPPVFSASTLAAGHELVVCQGAAQLNPVARYSQFLLNIQLAACLPDSRLRQTVLQACEDLKPAWFGVGWSVLTHPVSGSVQVTCHD